MEILLRNSQGPVKEPKEGSSFLIALIRFTCVVTPPVLHALLDMAFIALFCRSVITFVMDCPGQIGGVDKVFGVVMGILIAFPMSQLFCQRGRGVLQMVWDGEVPILSCIIQGGFPCLVGGVTFRGSGAIGYGLGQG